MPAETIPNACFIVAAANEEETAQFGARLADALEPGVVVALVGNLGAGKTRLVRAVAEGAGVDPREINSPTFVLVHEYTGRWPIFHFDTYRLRDVDDFLNLGAEEYFQSCGVSFVEWADKVASVLPQDHLRIEIATTGDTAREFRLIATGAVSQRILERLARPGGAPELSGTP